MRTLNGENTVHEPPQEWLSEHWRNKMSTFILSEIPEEEKIKALKNKKLQEILNLKKGKTRLFLFDENQICSITKTDAHYKIQLFGQNLTCSTHLTHSPASPVFDSGSFTHQCLGRLRLKYCKNWGSLTIQKNCKKYLQIQIGVRLSYWLKLY